MATIMVQSLPNHGLFAAITLPEGTRGLLVPTLREARLARYWSQLDLALRAGIGEGTVLAIEKGVNIPRLSTMRKIAEALGLEPGDIDWPRGGAEDTGEE